MTCSVLRTYWYGRYGPGSSRTGIGGPAARSPAGGRSSSPRAAGAAIARSTAPTPVRWWKLMASPFPPWRRRSVEVEVRPRGVGGADVGEGDGPGPAVRVGRAVGDLSPVVVVDVVRRDLAPGENAQLDVDHRVGQLAAVAEDAVAGADE